MDELLCIQLENGRGTGSEGRTAAFGNRRSAAPPSTAAAVR
ncbi:MAG TPA: hypothetical protein VMP01_26110 [Pirellulaceae bacterium]|nr:hypothetical protein [Pirellulaceae bacterium]